LKSNKIQIDENLLSNLEVFLATNFINKSETIFGPDYSKLKEQLNNTNKFLDLKLSSLSELKSHQLKLKVS
jgi:hypothetical protein